MKFSKGLRTRLRLLRQELQDGKDQSNGAISSYQIRYVPAYEILFLEYHSPFGYHSRKVFPLKLLENSPFPGYLIRLYAGYLMEGLREDARQGFPGSPLALQWDTQLKMHFAPFLLKRIPFV